MTCTFFAHLTPFPRAANEPSCFQSISLMVYVLQKSSEIKLMQEENVGQLHYESLLFRW